MPTLLDFRRRIRSVKNTQQITRAMKFVAAAMLRRAQERALAARPFAKELARVLRSTMSRITEPQHPLLAHRPEERILVIVMTGERGLAGAFNTNVLRKASDFFRANKNKKISVIPVGKKGRDSLKKAGFNVIAEYVNVLARVDFAVMSANLAAEKLLPVEAIRIEEESAAEQAASKVDYIYEQAAEQLLDKLLPRYVETQMLRAMLESSAAEHGARMTAMESATKNAGEVIDALTLHMNKVRQAAITKEIIEIVSGASSTA